MDTRNWVVSVITDLIKALDAIEYDVARYHLYDAIAAINAAHGVGAADPLVPVPRRQLILMN